MIEILYSFVNILLLKLLLVKIFTELFYVEARIEREFFKSKVNDRISKLLCPQSMEYGITLSMTT